MNTKQQHNSESEEGTKMISPAEYNKMLNHLNLVDVFLKTTKANLFNRDVQEGAELVFKENTSLKKLTSNIAIIEVKYDLKAKAGKRRIFEMNLKYHVTFSFDRELPAEFFEKYCSLSLPLQTFPYLRECVNSFISRMGLPALVLPLRKFLVGNN